MFTRPLSLSGVGPWLLRCNRWHSAQLDKMTELAEAHRVRFEDSEASYNGARRELADTKHLLEQTQANPSKKKWCVT